MQHTVNEPPTGARLWCRPARPINLLLGVLARVESMLTRLADRIHADPCAWSRLDHRAITVVRNSVAFLSRQLTALRATLRKHGCPACRSRNH